MNGAGEDDWMGRWKTVDSISYEHEYQINLVGKFINGWNTLFC